MKKFNQRAIFIPRGYGHTYSFSFKDLTLEYVIENHVIAITGADDVLNALAKSFNDPRTKLFFDKLCVSGDITRDFLLCVPIF